MQESRFEIDELSVFKRICGLNDGNIKRIEELMGVSIIPRGNTLIITAAREKSEPALKLLHLMTDLLYLKGESYEFDDFDIRYLTSSMMAGEDLKPDTVNRLKITLPDSGKIIAPRTVNQAHYIQSIYGKAVTFATGPAGTGKTFLAVATALQMLLTGKIQRIVLTRPAVEAGENLGYLPGSLTEKINPYLRPLYDALFMLQPFEKISRMMENQTIEIAPLAYMRGRTLSNAFIILDEGQNTTTAQMKMFLTRMGNNSKIVVSGDDTQIDLDNPRSSGLLHAKKILRDIHEIGFIQFTRQDISRHPVVEKIVEAYEKSG